MKRAVAIVLSIMLILAITLPATVSAASTSGKVSFNYATFLGDGNKDQVGSAILEYAKKMPNVKINTQVMDHDSYQQKLQIMVNSNTLPDLFWWNGLYLNDSLSKTKTTVDLTPYFDATFKARFVPHALDSITLTDGRITAFPAEMQVQAWMFNKALFDKYKLKIPTTSDELKKVVPVFKKNGIATISFGTKDPWPTWGFEQWETAWGCFDQADAAFNMHTIKYGDMGVVNVFKYIAELYDLGAFPKNNSTMNFEQMVTLFTSGKAAMISIPSDQLGKIVGTPVEKTAVYNWGITFPKSPYNQKYAIKAVSNGYGVGASAAKDKGKLNAIIAFNKWRYSDEAAVIPLKRGFNLPVNFSVDLSTFGPVVKQQAALIADKTVVPMLTSVYAYYNAVGQNVDLYNAYNTPQAAMQIALTDGSKRAKDIPAYIDKMEKIVAKQAPKKAK